MRTSDTPWLANIVTLYPEAFPGTLGIGPVGKALQAEKWALNTLNPRDFAKDKHRSVDDTPYGGGPGMVLRADILGKTLDTLYDPLPSSSLGLDYKTTPCYYLSPRGQRITQQWCEEQTEHKGITLLAGRFEGIDQRVIDHYGIQEICLGDFVLSGGEVAAMAVLEGIVRLLPDVMGSEDSGKEESFCSHLLEYPHYTRPAHWNNMDVPEVLRSGDHAAITLWRTTKAQQITRQQRPDLWALYCRHQLGNPQQDRGD